MSDQVALDWWGDSGGIRCRNRGNGQGGQEGEWQENPGWVFRGDGRGVRGKVRG